MKFIELKDVAYSIGKKKSEKQKLFENLNLTIDRNEIVSLSGSNGIGKTTLTKLIIGVLKPDYGQVILDGKDIEDYKRYEVGRKIGYLFQNPDLQLFNANVREELMFVYEFGKGISREIEARFSWVIEELSLGKTLDTPIVRLSQGEKQRVALGTVLMNKPKFIILDEPTVGLNEELIEDLKAILLDINVQGIGLLIISHNKEFVKSMPGRKLYLKDKGVFDE